MALPVYSELNVIHFKHAKALFGESEKDLNMRFFGFTVYNATAKKYGKETSDALLANISKVVEKNHKDVTDGIAGLISFYESNDLAVPPNDMDTVMRACEYDAYKFKKKGLGLEVQTFEIIWDIPLVWKAADVLAKSQYFYALHTIAKHSLDNPVFPNPRDYYRDLSFIPLPQILNKTAQALNELK